MKQKSTIILIVLLSFTTHTLLAGGPWPQQKGNGYFKLSEWWVVFDQHYTDQARIDPNITTGIFNTFFYGEYGITDRLTVTVNANLFSRNYTNNIISGTTDETIVAGEGLNALGDIDLGFKYGITKPGAKIPVAASVLFGLPTGTIEGGEQRNLQTGDGEFNQLIQLDAGTSFNLGSIPAYFSAYSGVNFRSKGFSEEFRYGGELGVSFANSKLWLVSKLAVIESFKNGNTAASVNSTSIFANNTEFASIGIEANYYLTNQLGVSANYTGAIRGEIIAAAPSYSFGVFLDLSK